MTQPAAGVLDPQGPYAEPLADLFWLMLALGVVVLAIFAVVLILSLRRRQPEGDLEQASSGPGPSNRWFVVGGVVAPLVVLVVVFVATVDAMRVVSPSPPRDSLRVEIVGHQFWWEVRYPEEGITLRNELRIPVGRPVSLRLTSADVIHSLWVPALGGKRDLMPDYVNTLVIQADEPAVHRTSCAEFCGLHHASMHLTVVAEEPDRFAAWVADRGG